MTRFCPPLSLLHFHPEHLASDTLVPKREGLCPRELILCDTSRASHSATQCRAIWWGKRRTPQLGLSPLRLPRFRCQWQVLGPQVTCSVCSTWLHIAGPTAPSSGSVDLLQWLRTQETLTHVDQVMVQATDSQVKTGLGCVTCWDLDVSPAPKLSGPHTWGFHRAPLYRHS